MGELQIIGSIDDLPPAFDGVVPIDEYREKMKAVADRVASYKGGRVHIGVGLFQACLFLAIILGFLVSRFSDMGSKSFFNPITLCVLGLLQFGVLSQSGRFFQREESTLTKSLLEIMHPWKQEYRIIAKMRKTRGKIGGEDSNEKRSHVYYCLVLEKMRPDDEIDTVSLSSFTDMESDVESQV